MLKGELKNNLKIWLSLKKEDCNLLTEKRSVIAVKYFEI